MGITLAPVVPTHFASWVAPQGAAGSAAPAGGAAESQTVFQIQPLPAPGALEYTIEIDGQQLRYRNTQSSWTNFIWPNPAGAPGARVSAVTFDGRTIEVANQPGRFGLERLINSANRKRKDGGVFELSWSSGGTAVSIDLKIISSAQVSGATLGNGSAPNLRGMKLPDVIAGSGAAPIAATDVSAVEAMAKSMSTSLTSVGAAQ